MTYFLLIPLAWAGIGQIGEGEVSPARFLEIIRASYADLKTLSLIFEGTTEFVRPGASEEQKRQKFESFDGRYFWRSDGSILNDAYLRFNVGDLMHSSVAVFGDKATLFKQFPDQNLKPIWQKLPPTGFALGWEEPNPQGLLWYWFYQTIRNPEELHYQYLGWEDVDGRRCLNVELDLTVVPEGRHTSRYRFWFDLDRAAVPLRVDFLLYPPHVGSTIRTVELEKRSVSATRSVWLPTSSVEETYVIGQNSHSNQPIYRKSTKIVRGTLRVNDPIPDSAFVLGKAGANPETSPSVLRRAFEEKLQNTPPIPSDPKSIQDRLDRDLAEADRQSRTLEASNPAHAFWSGTLITQVGLFALGIALFTWAALLLRRSR